MRRFLDCVYCYVITIFFLTISNLLKGKNKQWSDEYSVHKISPDIHLMCKLRVAVELYSSACSLFDAVSHSFPNTNSCILRNASVNNAE